MATRSLLHASTGALVCAAAASVVGNARSSATILYVQPETLNLTTHARVDPTTPLLDTTSISLWRIATPGEACAPITAWDGGNWTGLSIAPAFRAAEQCGLHPSHLGSTVAQYAAGAFGAQLNLYDTPPTASLGTLTVEYTWSEPQWVAPWPRGTSDGALIQCTALYQAPTAAKDGVAIYSSWSLGFHALSNASQYVWYETALFDLGRAFSQVIWMDTISGYPIVHSYLGVPSERYHTELPGCAHSSNATMPGLRWVGFTISASQFSAAIADANAVSGEGYSTDPADWALGHWNIEAEGTGEGRMGHEVKGLQLALVQPAPAAAAAAAGAGA
jgi:hypothetical protein